MFGALSDVASEVDALRAEIGGLQWSLARARGEGDNYFHGVDAHTGMCNVPFLALSAYRLACRCDRRGWACDTFCARLWHVRRRGMVGGWGG